MIDSGWYQTITKIDKFYYGLNEGSAFTKPTNTTLLANMREFCFNSNVVNCSMSYAHKTKCKLSTFTDGYYVNESTNFFSCNSNYY